MNKKLSWSASKSLSNCPFHNLAIEDSLLKGDFQSDAHFFFYRNRPSIILGRFQVPWREINFLKLKELNLKKSNKSIEVVRRRSGGGTVYHDLGNWNFCFVRKDRALSRAKNLAFIQEAMKSFGIDLDINERFDLTFTLDRYTYKVSGSAFKQKKDSSLHHGTLLIDAKLEDLKGVLGAPKYWKIEGKGIKSKPSPVINLYEYASDLSFDLFFSRMCRALDCEESQIDLEMVDRSEVDLLRSWNWLWGETPEFSVETAQFILSAKKGSLTSLALRQSGVMSITLCKDEYKLMDSKTWEELKEVNPLVEDLLSPFFE